jgi:hypothetical protein
MDDAYEPNFLKNIGTALKDSAVLYGSKMVDYQEILQYYKALK